MNSACSPRERLAAGHRRQPQGNAARCRNVDGRAFAAQAGTRAALRGERADARRWPIEWIWTQAKARRYSDAIQRQSHRRRCRGLRAYQPDLLDTHRNLALEDVASRVVQVLALTGQRVFAGVAVLGKLFGAAARARAANEHRGDCRAKGADRRRWRLSTLPMFASAWLG